MSAEELISVWPKYALWLLTEELPKQTEKYPECTAALAGVAALYSEWIETGKKPEADRWVKAKDASYSARGDDAANAACDAAASAAAFGFTDEADAEQYALGALDAALYAAAYSVPDRDKAAAREEASAAQAEKLDSLVAGKA